MAYSVAVLRVDDLVLGVDALDVGACRFRADPQGPRATCLVARCATGDQPQHFDFPRRQACPGLARRRCQGPPRRFEYGVDRGRIQPSAARTSARSSAPAALADNAGRYGRGSAHGAMAICGGEDASGHRDRRSRQTAVRPRADPCAPRPAPPPHRCAPPGRGGPEPVRCSTNSRRSRSWSEALSFPGLSMMVAGTPQADVVQQGGATHQDGVALGQPGDLGGPRREFGTPRNAPARCGDRRSVKSANTSSAESSWSSVRRRCNAGSAAISDGGSPLVIVVGQQIARRRARTRRPRPGRTYARQQRPGYR